jgi:hypothetical protein
MPRGSAPGERRGGRKKGTQNRKTLIMKAAVENYIGAISTPSMAMRLISLRKFIRTRNIRWLCANAMQTHLPDFLGLNYSLAASMTAGDRSRADRSLRFNMDDWPNAQTIRSTMTDWHAAFMKLHDAWRLVPEQYRQGLREPPKALSTS